MSEPNNSPQGRKTTVEDGTHFKGALSSNCPVEVKGRVEGEVQAPALAVSPEGAVHGRVRVGHIQSHGEISGEFDAETVLLSGAVKDGTVIRAKSLEVKLAAPDGKMQLVFGECKLEVGEPASAEAIRPHRPSKSSAPPRPDVNGA
jgi:cytoskeletal protein CcmA (bactofilin family)